VQVNERFRETAAFILEPYSENRFNGFEATDPSNQNMKRAIALLLLGLILIAQSEAATQTGKISGLPVHRHNGTWLGIQLSAGNFRVTFYDKNKDPMAADATSVVLSWTTPKTGTYAPPPSSTQLFPLADISSVLTNSFYVPYSHPMSIKITLIVPASDPSALSPATETYNVKFTVTG
jgi:hypothetical protein